MPHVSLDERKANEGGLAALQRWAQPSTLWRLTAVGLLLLCTFVLIGGCEQIWTLVREDRRPNRYLIPEGFVGWVRIDYEVEGTPELPIEDGFYIYRIPPTGHLETSSTQLSGWASDEYYYVDDSGNMEELPATGRNEGGLIWREIVGYLETRGTRELVFEQFFVGPEELAQQHANREGREPVYGPVSPADP